jgi:pSer/pThr/pTyr-binding forkhead associated (FHA) protein
MELSKSRPSLRFGRGTENDFVVPDHQASRLHARIELRRDRFVLVDQSMNGTYVQMDGVAEVCLRRDEVPLKGTGLISLGRATASEAAIHIRFTCL